jgi:hypothetical protein
MAGDAAAKKNLKEGLDFIHKSIEVNPEAHFGREIWQAVTAEFMLAVMETPELLLQYDMVGNRLDSAVDPSRRRSIGDSTGYSGYGDERWVAAYLQNQRYERHPSRLRQQYITHVGAEDGWGDAVATSHRKPVPFDEPTLGIIGMWRLGGGANPHFALALGEIMLRVGQRYIAWCAYERAAMMADKLWPDPSIQKGFVEHCRKRQGIVEAQLPRQDRVEIRPRFVAELEYGQAYQKAYQDYEAAQISRNVSLDDPQFYDAFFTQHAPIASPLGEADKFVVEPQSFRGNWPPIVFFAGLAAFLGAIGLYFVIARCRLADKRRSSYPVAQQQISTRLDPQSGFVRER